MIVTLYTKANCPPCKFTARKLDDAKVPYRTVPVDTDPVAKAAVVEMGYLSAPVVSVDLGDGATWTWGGFQPTQLDKLRKLMLNGAATGRIFAA